MIRDALLQRRFNSDTCANVQSKTALAQAESAHTIKRTCNDHDFPMQRTSCSAMPDAVFDRGVRCRQN
jgi:hypothetical protein